jgi:predicted RNA-binding protein with PUA-like domain
LFFQAAEVHKLFKKHPHAKKQFEPQILSGDLCLGYAINGIAGLVSTAGTSRRDATQLELFERVFHAASVRFSSRWQNLSNRDQQKVIAQYVTEFLPSLPPELHQAYRRFLKSEKLEAGR